MSSSGYPQAVGPPLSEPCCSVELAPWHWKTLFSPWYLPRLDQDHSRGNFRSSKGQCLRCWLRVVSRILSIRCGYYYYFNSRLRLDLPQCATDGHVEERSHLHATKEKRVRTSPDKTINWLLLLLLLLPSR